MAIHPELIGTFSLVPAAWWFQPRLSTGAQVHALSTASLPCHPYFWLADWSKEPGLQINMVDHVIVGQSFDGRPDHFSFKETVVI